MFVKKKKFTRFLNTYLMYSAYEYINTFYRTFKYNPESAMYKTNAGHHIVGSGGTRIFLKYNEVAL